MPLFSLIQGINDCVAIPHKLFQIYRPITVKAHIKFTVPDLGDYA